MSSSSVPAAIAAIWQRQRPQTRERLVLLRRVADEAVETRTLEPALQTEAREIAHKLAGSLGMFGHHDATEHARAIELELSGPGLPQPERLQRHVGDLAASLAEALA